MLLQPEYLSAHVVVQSMSNPPLLIGALEQNYGGVLVIADLVTIVISTGFHQKWLTDYFPV